MSSFFTASHFSYKGVADFADRWVRTPIVRRLSTSGETLRKTAVVPGTTVISTPVPAPVNPPPPGYSTLSLPDGARIAYEILGTKHLGHTKPIVLICGMTSVRVDWERLTEALVKSHPVLLYDHRGMGDSTLTPGGEEEISIDLMARDLLALLDHLKWTEVSLCGYSMGGVIAQQLLLLPYHLSNPIRLPFRVTHVVLASTRSIVTANAGLRVGPLPPSGERTLEEKKAIARRIVSTLVDPAWISSNEERFKYVFRRATNPAYKRPSQILAKQGAALQKFDFADLLVNFPKETSVLIIHGRLDSVIPFSCSEDTMLRIPSAKSVEEGNQPGQVPTLDFGHFWFEYFDSKVWHDVMHNFIAS